MATITTRSGKGSPLTNTEVDSNFTNLNTDKLESGDNISVLTNDSGYITSYTVTLADVTSALTYTPVDPAGDSMTGNLSFGDNAKAIFGAGSDLQIYSDGNNGNIQEVSSTGSLRLQGANLYLQNQDGSENYARFFNNGAAELYYDNSKKLDTTSTGIDVTGTVTADGLTVGAVAYPSTDGTADQVLTTNGSGTISFADAPVSLPDQTGYSGYYLTTDGTNASWAQVSGGGSNADGGFANSTYISAQSVDGGSASG